MPSRGFLVVEGKKRSFKWPRLRHTSVTALRWRVAEPFYNAGTQTSADLDPTTWWAQSLPTSLESHTQCIVDLGFVD